LISRHLVPFWRCSCSHFFAQGSIVKAIVFPIGDMGFIFFWVLNGFMGVKNV